jgi:hypothetical protein
MVGFCPSCFTLGSFSSDLISLPELDFDIEDDDEDAEVFAVLKLLLLCCCPNEDCGFPMCDVVGDCDVLSSLDDKFVGVPTAVRLWSG